MAQQPKYLTLNHLNMTLSALLNKLETKANEDDLAEVAFTGSYNDLENTPNLAQYATLSDLVTARDSLMQDADEYFMVIGRDYVTAGQLSGTTLGTKATAEGYQTTATANYSHAEGNHTTASGAGSHAEGTLNKALNSSDHVEGSKNTALGGNSHAEGNYTTAFGNGSHVEGYFTIARGEDSHVEGCNDTGYTVTLTKTETENVYTINTTTIPTELIPYLQYGFFLGRQGYDDFSYITHITSATENTITVDTSLGFPANSYSTELHFPNTIGNYSHSEGIGNIAVDEGSHAGGQYNLPLTNMAEVIGNGHTVNGWNPVRSNARTLDWSGNETLAGKLTVGANPVNNMDVVTKQYMESKGYLTLATLPVYDGTVV